MRSTRRTFVKSAAVFSMASPLSSLAGGPDEAQGSLDLYVSPLGKDSNPGTARSPFATVARAQTVVRQTRKMRGRVTVWLAEGWYFQRESLTFGPEDGGHEGGPVIYRALPGHRPIVTGGRRLGGKWESVPNKPYKVLDVPEARNRKWSFNMLYIDGRSRPVARKANPMEKSLTGTGPVVGEPDNSVFYFSEGDLDANWERQEDAYLVLTNSWTSIVNKIIGIDNSKKIGRIVSHSARPLNFFYKEFPYYVCNFLEVLDSPGEWYLDRVAGKLYYYLLPGEDPERLEVIAPVVMSTLVDIVGTPGTPVSYLEFHDIAFRHTDWSMERTDGIYRQGCMFLHAAVNARYLTHGAFRRCEFSELGEYAMELSDGCQYNEVTQCHIRDIGGGGIQIGITDLPTLKKLEEHALPQDTRSLHNMVANCLIHGVGTIWPGVYGIVNRFASFSIIKNNEIFDVPWCAIGSDARWNPFHPGDEYSRGNEVSYNHLHDLGLGYLRDTAGYYQFGPLDTHVHHNLIHDTVGKADEYVGYCGIYLDEQSRGTLVEHNLAFRLDGLAYFQNWGVDTAFRNNIGAFARDGFFNRGGMSKDSPVNSFSCTRNIYISASKKMLARIWSPLQVGSSVMDYNLYWDVEGDQSGNDFAGSSFTKRQELGLDRHSVIADPMFRNPVHGDFSFLQSSHVTEQIGFIPFEEEIAKAGLQGEVSWRTLGQRMPRRPRPTPSFGFTDQR